MMARTERMLAYSIAGAAGFVDAAGFLSADRYFVSFMSGNTTRLGVELASGSRAAFIALLLLAGFVLGVTTGAIVAGKFGHRRMTAVLSLSAALLFVAAIGSTLGHTAIFLGGAVLAMGALNNVFRRNGQVSLGVTYMTGALVRVGEGLAGMIDGSGRGVDAALPSLLLWASLSSGAVLGAVTYLHGAQAEAWIAVGWLVALAFAALAKERRQPS